MTMADVAAAGHDAVPDAGPSTTAARELPRAWDQDHGGALGHSL